MIALLAEPLLPAVITVEGDCTLVEAIRAANNDAAEGACPAGSGADAILLTGDVVLNAVEVLDDGSNGLPTVTSEISIDGRGHTIERDLGSLSDFRIVKVGTTGVLTLENSTVSGGVAAEGGAIRNHGDLTIQESTLSSNFAESLGGAVFNEGSLHAVDSVFASNSVGASGSTSRGGAVYNYGTSLVAERSTFIDNRVGSPLFPAFNGQGGAISLGSQSGVPVEPVVISGSTLSGNNVLATSQRRGSAIDNISVPLTITNSTISANGGISVVGAVSAGPAQLTNVTFSGNSNYALSAYFATVYATGVILANSAGDNCVSPENIVNLNSVADDDSCGDIPGGLTGLDAALADNGGPTLTHALLSGSNAIDAAGVCSLPTDQRGAPRVGSCDIGAFEFMGCPILTLADDTVSTAKTYEECAIEAGPNFVVAGPEGDLTLHFGTTASFADGFAVDTDAGLTLEHDPSLQLLLDELIEADRARRRPLQSGND